MRLINDVRVLFSLLSSLVNFSLNSFFTRGKGRRSRWELRKMKRLKSLCTNRALHGIKKIQDGNGMLFVVSGRGLCSLWTLACGTGAEMGKNGRAKRRTQLHGFDVSITKRHAGFSEHQSHIFI